MAKKIGTAEKFRQITDNWDDCEFDDLLEILEGNFLNNAEVLESDEFNKQYDMLEELGILETLPQSEKDRIKELWKWFNE